MNRMNRTFVSFESFVVSQEMTTHSARPTAETDIENGVGACQW